jgi:hypothetical protein
MFLPERKAKRRYVDENFGRTPTTFPEHKTNSLKNWKLVLLLKKLTVFLYSILYNSFSSKRRFLKFVALTAVACAVGPIVVEILKYFVAFWIVMIFMKLR